MFKKSSASPVILAIICLLNALAFAQAHSHHEMGASSSARVNTLNPAKTATFVGEAKPIGNGTARTWVTLGADGKPTAIGVTFTEAALTGLPPALTPRLIWTEFLLPLPPEASVTGFNHVGLNWNPKTSELFCQSVFHVNLSFIEAV